MNQDDIFKLLLIVLLLANRQLSNASEDNDDFSYASINDLLIFAMLLGGFGEKDCSNTTF